GVVRLLALMIAVHVVDGRRLGCSDCFTEGTNLVFVLTWVVSSALLLDEPSEMGVRLVARIVAVRHRGQRADRTEGSLPRIDFLFSHDGAYLISRIVDWLLPSPSTAFSRNLRNSPTTVSM